MTSEEIMARVLYRDGLVIVIDKPAGLPVHPGHGGGETLADHLDALRFGMRYKPQIAHRLDRGTSGCLALGRHPKALAKLGRLFSEGRAEKLYWAIVSPAPAQDEGVVEAPLAPVSPQTPWRMRVDLQGLPARTRFQVLARAADGGRAHLALVPETGRTHQLRVHCAAQGFPILGDGLYGGAPRGALLHLHARALTLPLSGTKRVHVEAPAPDHMAAAIAELGPDRAPR